MKQNPHQQFQQQVQRQQQQRQRQQAGYAWQQQQKQQKQLQQQQQIRQRQMEGYAWQQEQDDMAMYAPVTQQRGGCARAFSAVWTFAISLIVLGVFLGVGGYFAGGIVGGSDDTAMLGAIVGGLIAFIWAGINANRAANN